MATKKTKKTPELKLQGFDDVDFNKEPDIQAAQKINQPIKKEVLSTPLIEEKKAVSVSSSVSQPPSTMQPSEVRTETSKKNVVKTGKRKETIAVTKGTFAPPDKKRASFNIEEDLHRALKEYSFFEEIDMVTYIFEQLVKPDLKKKGYYPPKKRRR